MIRRRGAREEDSSDEEADDMFDKLAKEQQKSGNENAPSMTSSLVASQTRQLPIIPSTTSSMKRHHIASNARKKEMDSLLQELETEKPAILREPRTFVPQKRGSYVSPEDEHLTTNLFIGNLDPALTEQQIKHLFQKFGVLQSLKVMWPRTEEDRERNRLSCFVCYRYRQDAEIAMDACSEADPFHVGRRLMVRWGKNIGYNGSSMDHYEPTNKRPRGDSLSNESLPSEEVSTHLDHTRESLATSIQPNDTERRRLPGRPVDGSWELEPKLLEEFHLLTRRKLCASRQSICEAMAFCFDHSSASTQISHLLKDLLLEKNCSLDTYVARLYLLSDVLFNSQQPGIKNAFRYRDAIEKMTPTIFASLGLQCDAAARGRMTRQKMHLAIRSVLAAWTKWSVFDPTFLDELEACFEKREIVKLNTIKEDSVNNLKVEKEVVENQKEEIIILSARGDWTEISEDDVLTENQPGAFGEPKEKPTGTASQSIDSNDSNEIEAVSIDGEPLDDDDLDEEGLRILHSIHFVTDDDDTFACGNLDAERTTNSSDIDGEPLGEDDLECTTI